MAHCFTVSGVSSGHEGRNNAHLLHNPESGIASEADKSALGTIMPFRQGSIVKKSP